MEAIQSYLAVIVRKQYIEEEIIEYSMRLLSVMAYHKIVLGKKDEINEEAIKCIDGFFSILHYENDNLKRDILTKFKAWQNFVVDIMIKGFRKVFESKLASNFYRQRKAILSQPAYQAQFKKILDGITVTDLQHPHLVVLDMLSDCYHNIANLFLMLRNIITSQTKLSFPLCNLE